MKNYKKTISIVLATAVFGVMLFVPQVQSAIADGLSVFRVQKIQSVEVDIAELEKMGRELHSQIGEIDLKQFGKLNIKDQGVMEEITLSEAKDKVPFALKYPAAFDLKQNVRVMGATDADFSLKVEEVNKILKQLGSKSMLPELLEGENFNISSSGNVSLTYFLDNNQVRLTQMESPQITVPENVNTKELRDILIAIPIVPEEIKSQLKNVRDLENTLLVPTDKNNKESLVKIGDTQGVLHTNVHFKELIWLEDGVIYSLSSRGDVDLAAIAQGLKDA